MELMDLLEKVDPKLLKAAEKMFKVIPVDKYLKNLPPVKKALEKEYEKIIASMDESIHPYKEVVTHPYIPQEGLSKEEILKEVTSLQKKEEHKWKEGYASGSVYHGDQEHIDFMNEVYSLTSQCNQLHFDIWPSTAKYEAEIVSMTAQMLGAGNTQDDICGTVTSGGSESILMAMKAYRDYARAKGVKRPEMIVPSTAHPAFSKAAHYFKIKKVSVPVRRNHKANLIKMTQAINSNTVVMVGSAPNYPQGVIDPIEELSEIAREHNIGFHTDACLGGFFLPWAKKLGRTIPEFDFNLPGVTSMSADTHKYGYAPKGTSVVLYRNEELRHYQYFKQPDWPGGLYFSPTVAGSRPGGLSMACWASLVKMGEEGYMKATQKILDAVDKIKAAVDASPDLYIMGNPLCVVSIGAKSKRVDIYQVLEHMVKRGWSLTGIFRPPGIHISMTLRHAQPGVAERFIQDLKESVETVKQNPSEKTGTAPVYGVANTLPEAAGGLIGDILDRLMDSLYKVTQKK